MHVQISQKIGKRSSQPYDIVRVVLASVLILAATLKGHQLATEPVLALGVFDSRWMLIVVAEFELVFGLWWLAGFCRHATWCVALTCFTAFGVVSAQKALAGDASCGCFGSVAVSPWLTLVFDIVAVVAIACARPHTAGAEPIRLFSIHEFTVFAMLIAVPSAMLMGGFSAATVAFDGSISGEGRVVVLDPEEWVGQKWPLLNHVDIGTELADGDWTVVIFRHDCSKCHELIDQYTQQAKTASTELGRVAFIEVPPFVNSSRRFDTVTFNYGRLSNSYDWFVTTPVVMTLSNGSVVVCEEGNKASFSQNMTIRRTDPGGRVFDA